MDLIESYYAVAQDLQRQSDIFAQAAKLVAEMADSYSEARMREKRPTPTPPSEPEKS